MSISKHQINEAGLKARISELKAGNEITAIKEYLIGAIASGRLPARLQATAYNELGLVHLQLDDPMEAEKAFRSAMECNTGFADDRSAATENRTHETGRVTPSDSNISK